MREIENFYNQGFGWICRKCDAEAPHDDDLGPSRLMREGEAESKNPSLSSQFLARWADREHTTLECPRCGITEKI
jgi:hypothetical protein